MAAPSSRRYLPSDVEVLSLASTNVTASDLPGPGRILGNVFSYLGRKVELAIESLAVSRGYGPENVVSRIRERDYAYRERDWPHHNYTRNYTDDDTQKQTKDLKRLLRYAR